MGDLNKKISELLNKQINEEYYSSYLYMSMSCYLMSIGLEGCAHWMRKQASEEYSHAMKICEYLHQRGASVKLLAIDAPKHAWESPVQVFDETVMHEKKVTSLINNIYECAISEKEYQVQCFMTWFVTEQVEEEATAMSLLEKLKRLQSSNIGLMLFDAELSKRE